MADGRRMVVINSAVMVLFLFFIGFGAASEDPRVIAYNETADVTSFFETLVAGRQRGLPACRLCKSPGECLSGVCYNGQCGSRKDQDKKCPSVDVCQECTGPEECLSGICFDGRCGSREFQKASCYPQPVPVGSRGGATCRRCARNNQCRSGVCFRGRCGSRRVQKERCRESEACLLCLTFRDCRFGVCTGGRCGSAQLQKDLNCFYGLLPIFERCRRDNECAGGHCVNGKCGTLPKQKTACKGILERFVIRLNLGLVPKKYRDVFNKAAVRWSEIITKPNVRKQYGLARDIDIKVQVRPIDGKRGILGYGGPQYLWRQPSGKFLPYAGVMVFDEEDFSGPSADRLYDVALHEMGHVLGFGTLWNFGSYRFLDGANGSSPNFNGPMAVAEYNKLLQRQRLPLPRARGVPVEGNISGRGSADSHWSEQVFHNELMTPYLNDRGSLSAVTIASLGDLGYTVNVSAADYYDLRSPRFPLISAPSKQDGSTHQEGFYCSGCRVLRPKPRVLE